MEQTTGQRKAVADDASDGLVIGRLELPDDRGVRLSQIRSLEDIKRRLRANWPGYVHEYWILLALALAASVADAASTIHFMRFAGPDAEWHPTVRLVSFLFGPILGPILGKAAQVIVLIVVTVFLRRHATFIFIPAIILYGWAAWYNLWGYQFYYPPILRILEYLAL